jgi:ABC-2 type transport system permease protein
MKKYLYFTLISARQSWGRKGSSFGRVFFYGIILFVFSRLWVMIGKHSELENSARDMLWYLAMTEWIVLSIPYVSMEVEEDVRSGNIAYLLGRPTSYLWSKYFESLGALFVRLAVMAVGGIIFGLLFTGGWPTNPQGLLLFLPLGIAACLVLNLFNVGIGLTSFWLQDSMPLYWIWQKCNFVLGGMMIPLSIYPEWAQKIAVYLPFHSFLYGPAQTGLKADFGFGLIVLVKLVGWFSVAAFLVTWIYKRALKDLCLNGG